MPELLPQGQPRGPVVHRFPVGGISWVPTWVIRTGVFRSYHSRSRPAPARAVGCWPSGTRPQRRHCGGTFAVATCSLKAGVRCRMPSREPQALLSHGPPQNLVPYARLSGSIPGENCFAPRPRSCKQRARMVAVSAHLPPVHSCPSNTYTIFVFPLLGQVSQQSAPIS